LAREGRRLGGCFRRRPGDAAKQPMAAQVSRVIGLNIALGPAALKAWRGGRQAV